MLNKKMFRDIKQNKSQFLTIFLMLLIGIMAYSGIEAYMSGMINAANKFYEENNLQDLNVLGTSFSKKDVEEIKKIESVKDAERKLTVTGIDANNKEITYSISFIETNQISKFYVKEGSEFSNTSGVWMDVFYAKENNIKVGDTIEIKYDTFTLKEEVKGIVYIPDHVYDTKDESEIVTDRSKFGVLYLSYTEIPEDYITNLVLKETGLPTTDYISNYNYKDYIPYNYIMVDVDTKENVKDVKNKIEDTIQNALAVIKIEDSASYQMYQGEIDEGKAYVGVFSGLFIFIAVLSVVTTMTRVVKKQKTQIGTLKALGLSKAKISLHYVNYVFFLAILASICGILLGKFFLGTVFINLEMSFFEMPNGVAVIESKSYLVALLVILLVSFITYFTCRKECQKKPADSLRNELPKVKKGSLNITTKGIFKYMGFSSKWNLRDIVRNKFRTITGVVGIVGCCTLIVCALGMLNSINRFVELQFEELYHFDYKLSLKSNITEEEEYQSLISLYGDSTSKTLAIEYVNKENDKITNNIFVDESKDLVRFKDKNDNYLKITSKDGVYITQKLASSEGYQIGDTIRFHIYGDSTYYEAKIIGFNKDPQNQNITMTREYLESLNITYKPDSLYTNYDLSGVKEIDGVELVQDIDSLKESIESMLSMMKEMIVIIIVFAVLLGSIIIYNMGILSYSEKQYQFATLKVLGFTDKKIQKIFIEQNLWITIVSILIGLPSGYYLTDWLFMACLDEKYDFSVYINTSTYVIASIGTFLVAYFVSKRLSRRIKQIDMVSSLKGNE